MTSKIIPAFDRTQIEIYEGCVVITQTTDGNDYSISIPLIFATEFIRQLMGAIGDAAIGATEQRPSSLKDKSGSGNGR